MDSEKPKLTVYLSGPMADCTLEEQTCWRNKMKEDLPDVEFLDPCRREFKEYESMETAIEIVEKDKEDVDNSDVIFVFHNKPSVGTSMEILYAFEKGKYVLTVHATGMPLSPWILYHSSMVVKTIEEATEVLKSIAAQYNSYEVNVWEDMS